MNADIEYCNYTDMVGGLFKKSKKLCWHMLSLRFIMMPQNIIINILIQGTVKLQILTRLI